MPASRTTSILLLVLLSLAAVWRWSKDVGSAAILPDEQVYVRAALHVGAGESPYLEPQYFYPPVLASALDLSFSTFGQAATLRGLRSLSLASIVGVVWWLLEKTAWPWVARLALGTLFLTAAPAVEIATSLGNAAGLAVAPALLALFSWHLRPVRSGLMLGLALGLKPVAWLGLPGLALHRPATSIGRQHIVAAASGLGALAVACLPGVRHLGGLLDNARGAQQNPYNFSLHSILRDLGLSLSPLVLVAAAVIAVLLWSRRCPRQPRDVALVVIAGSLLGLPFLWAHSLLLALPIQIRVVNRLTARSARDQGRFAVPIRVLAGLGVAATLLPQAVGIAAGLPEWAALAARTATLLAIPYLAWFVLRQPDEAIERFSNSTPGAKG